MRQKEKEYKDKMFADSQRFKELNDLKEEQLKEYESRISEMVLHQ